MTEFEEPWWVESEEEFSVEEFLSTEVELSESEGAVSGRVRRDQVSDKTREAAARILLKLDERRERKGLTKADLARKVKKQPASLRRLFGRESNPEIFTLIEIANALEADIVLKPRKKRPTWRDEIEPF